MPEALYFMLALKVSYAWPICLFARLPELALGGACPQTKTTDDGEIILRMVAAIFLDPSSCSAAPFLLRSALRIHPRSFDVRRDRFCSCDVAEPASKISGAHTLCLASHRRDAIPPHPDGEILTNPKRHAPDSSSYQAVNMSLRIHCWSQ